MDSLLSWLVVCLLVVPGYCGCHPVILKEARMRTKLIHGELQSAW